MNNTIIVTVALPGIIGGSVKSVDRQTHSVLVNHGITLTKEIIHTDRKISECSRRFSVDGDIVSKWVSGDCPYWENPKNWNKMSEKRRIVSYVHGYDEGYGVTFDIIEDSGV